MLSKIDFKQLKPKSDDSVSVRKQMLQTSTLSKRSMARATWCKCPHVNMANIDNTNRGSMNPVLIIVNMEKKNKNNIVNIDLSYLQSKYGEYI